MADRAILAATMAWCLLRYPVIWKRTYDHSGVFPDPARPASYVDKFLWRKIFDHNPLYVTACDKLASKQYALSVCPELKTAKVLWSGRDAKEIPPALLTGNVVVKANHGCRWNMMIRDGEVDRAKLLRRTARWMRNRYGRKFGEWAYKGARQLIFVEEMLIRDDVPVPLEYKFHISNGKTAYVYAARRDGQGNELKSHFDRDGNYAPVPPGSGSQWVKIDLPPSFLQMREIAERLTAPFDHMRCDFYEIDGEIYFSEFSVYPLSGKGIINTRLRDLAGDSWDIRQSWFVSTPQRGWRKFYAAALLRWLDATERQKP
ncbi:ATP-grasp fold amidoligase family protein [Mesorhizobium sp. GbtcB19]|uniref:ATP-grasp fold amidoligase family protein n=1 Tax=Mesorhizobium sp. GbtcB19 TaxID=2824764 RepID=UPI001C30625C|nr:ATP-grasp fold amidoligase family protein [Mesorhizobium sp. GbtcB19]